MISFSLWFHFVLVSEQAPSEEARILSFQIYPWNPDMPAEKLQV